MTRALASHVASLSPDAKVVRAELRREAKRALVALIGAVGRGNAHVAQEEAEKLVDAVEGLALIGESREAKS